MCIDEVLASYSSATAPDFHRLPYSAGAIASGHLMQAGQLFNCAHYSHERFQMSNAC
jgi:hypothetical protein